MPRGKNTQEYQTVKKSYPNLSDAIAGVIDWVCERLLAKGLITDGQRAEANIGFVPAKNRASTVTGLLLNKVEQDTKYFQSLVDVLQQDKDTFGTVLEQMGVTVADGNASGIPQVQNKRNAPSESGPATKRRRTDCESDNVTIDDLNAVIEALWDARGKWKDIGRCIGVDAGTLDTMTGPADACLRDTLSHWLKGVYKPSEQNSKPRTWHTLIEALRTKMVNEAAMANKLEKEKCPDTVQDSSRNARGVSDKPQVRRKRKVRSAANGSDLEPAPIAKGKKTDCGARVPLKFSDNLSPNDLVAWLSQELVARSLTLDDAMKDKLIEEEINGEAFKGLSIQDLKDMGFKMGPRKNILKIIEDLNK